MKVNVKEISIPYEFKLPSGHVLFRVEEARLSYEQFDGSMGSEVTRVNFERGDAVGVLLYAEETGEVILVSNSAILSMLAIGKKAGRSKSLPASRTMKARRLLGGRFSKRPDWNWPAPSNI